MLGLSTLPARPNGRKIPLSLLLSQAFIQLFFPIIAAVFVVSYLQIACGRLVYIKKCFNTTIGINCTDFILKSEGHKLSIIMYLLAIFNDYLYKTARVPVNLILLVIILHFFSGSLHSI